MTMTNYSVARRVTSRMLQVYSLSRLTTGQHMSRCYSKSSVPEDFDETEPLKFSSSGAATWKAENSRRGGSDDEKPWEENDIDKELAVSLYDRVPGLEEAQLLLSLREYKEKGLDTKEIENRLAILKQVHKENSNK